MALPILRFSETNPSPSRDGTADHAALLRCLQQSELFIEYRAAFEATTGLPLVLRAAGSFQTPLQDSKQANPFCSLLMQANKTCAACLQLQQRVETAARLKTATLQCHAGLSESAVPVRLGHQLLGYLQTGQIFFKGPSRQSFATLARAKVSDGTDLGDLKAAYFQTRVITRKQYSSILRLLVIFAEHLAAVSNQLLTAQSSAESPVSAKIRAFIARRQHEPLGLDETARAAGMSPFYFCRVFKKATGLTFTDYLARARIEGVKHRLLDVHQRISEAAFAAGFQSISQFNRVFLRVAGETPRCYRDRLHGVVPLPLRPALAAPLASRLRPLAPAAVRCG
jgi:AraC-like DNA-binding protein/ligand-binding sensor protein